MTEEQQFEACTDEELIAIWNIMQFPVLKCPETLAKHARQQPIVDRILTERRIRHAVGQRTWRYDGSAITETPAFFDGK